MRSCVPVRMCLCWVAIFFSISSLLDELSDKYYDVLYVCSGASEFIAAPLFMHRQSQSHRRAYTYSREAPFKKETAAIKSINGDIWFCKIYTAHEHLHLQFFGPHARFDTNIVYIEFSLWKIVRLASMDSHTQTHAQINWIVSNK